MKIISLLCCSILSFFCGIAATSLWSNASKSGVLINQVDLVDFSGQHSLTLPRGTIVTCPRGDDFGITSPDDDKFFKIYVWFDNDTINQIQWFPDAKTKYSGPFVNGFYQK